MVEMKYLRSYHLFGVGFVVGLLAAFLDSFSLTQHTDRPSLWVGEHLGSEVSLGRWLAGSPYRHILHKSTFNLSNFLVGYFIQKYSCRYNFEYPWNHKWHQRKHTHTHALCTVCLLEHSMATFFSINHAKRRRKREAPLTLCICAVAFNDHRKVLYTIH